MCLLQYKNYFVYLVTIDMMDEVYKLNIFKEI